MLHADAAEFVRFRVPDGIVSVSARDLETGQEQAITVTATSGLSEDEIKDMVNKALTNTADFVSSTYRPVARIAQGGGSLKEAWDACRAECDPKFADYAIYEHCLPFNVARAYDEALDIDTPRIWTAERDRQMWEALQG